MNGVKNSGLRPYCDSLNAEDFVMKTMIECWAEKPQDRPDVFKIRSALKKMFEGYEGSAMVRRQITCIA